MSRRPFLFCAGCGKRMPLPAPSPEETSNDPHPWPTGSWTATVLHLECGRLSVYTVRELRGQRSPQTMVRDREGRERPLEVHEWRRVRLSCAEPCCTAQTIVFVYLSSASSAQRITSTLFGLPKVWRCPAWHQVPFGEAQQEEAFSLE